jgi:hypothetical protein
MTIQELVGECVIWTGAKTSLGYGIKRVGKRSLYAHRISYCDAHQKTIEEIHGLVVRHRCDNPSCVNPDHLEIGTQADNMRDKASRGRGFASPETLQKMADAQVRRYQVKPISEETRARMSESHKGNKHTQESREKIRLAHIGKKASSGAKEKMIASWAIRKQIKGG